MSRNKVHQEIASLSYDNNSLIALQDQAKILVKKQNYEGCWRVLNQIEELYGATAELLVNKGLVLYRLGILQDAIDILEASLELDETNENSIKLLEKMRQRLKALRDYTMGIYQ